jgi:hypothetical protein
LTQEIEEYVKAHPEEEPRYSHPVFEKCIGDKELYREFNPYHMLKTFLTVPDQKILFECENHRRF